MWNEISAFVELKECRSLMTSEVTKCFAAKKRYIYGNSFASQIEEIFHADSRACFVSISEFTLYPSLFQPRFWILNKYVIGTTINQLFPPFKSLKFTTNSDVNWILSLAIKRSDRDHTIALLCEMVLLGIFICSKPILNDREIILQIYLQQ